MKKTHTFSPAVKSSIALLITQLIQRGLQVFTTPILTRLLSTEEYGQVSLFLSWYEILIIFTGICLTGGVFNNGMLDFKNDRDCFTLSLYTLTFVSTCVVGSIVTVFCACVWNFINLPLPLIAYIFILQAFEGALSLWSVKQRFEYKYKALATITIVLAITSTAGGIIGILLVKENVVAANILGTRSVFLIVYFLMLLLLVRNAKGKIRLAYWKYALKFNLPIIPHYLSQHILNHMDRIQIAAYVGESSAGIYYLAYSGSSVVKLFWTAINASLIPWTYEQCEKRQFKRIDSLTRTLVFFYALLCLIIMFLAPEIINILAPKSYYEGIYVIPSVIIGNFFSMLYFIFANIVYYYKKPTYVMIASCSSAVVNVLLNTIFIPRVGYIAAGYTTAVSYLMQVIIDYYAMRKVTSEKIYEMRYIVSISIVVVIIGLILNLIYGYIICRYSLLAIMLAFLIFYIRKSGLGIFAELFAMKR